MKSLIQTWHDKPVPAIRLAGLRTAVLLTCALPFLTTRGYGGQSSAAAITSFAFMQAPPDAKIVRVSLSVMEHSAGRQTYLSRREPQPAEELTSLPPAISQSYTGKDYSAYEFASLGNGARYIVVLSEAKDIKFLTRNDSPFWHASIYRVTAGTEPKAELLREGFQTSGNDVVIPVELEAPGLGATKVKMLRTEVGYSLNSFGAGKPQVSGGRGNPITAGGSQMISEGKLTLTITLPDELKVTPGTQASIRFEPLAQGLPERTGAGKVSDILSVGAARFIITDIAPDFSSATVAVLAGSVEEAMRQQLKLGSSMPEFSQLDLVSRKVVTREDVVARAKGAAGVIFIFGDLASASRSGPYMPSMPGNLTLPLPVTEIVQQTEVEHPRPLIVLVTRQISMEFLYQDLRNKTPEYLVLADYADPLRTTFRVPQSNNGYWGGSPMSRDPSLRQLFNLPDKVCVAAFDAKGKVVYVKADVGTEFLPTLSDARAALRRR